MSRSRDNQGTLTLTATYGDVDVDPVIDLDVDRRAHACTWVKVEVNDGVNVYVAVKLNDGVKVEVKVKVGVEVEVKVSRLITSPRSTRGRCRGRSGELAASRRGSAQAPWVSSSSASPVPASAPRH